MRKCFLMMLFLLLTVNDFLMGYVNNNDVIYNADWRNIRSGGLIPHWSYCDQPYITKTKNGDWLCLITAAHSEESDLKKKQSAATLSRDQGKTWTPLVTVDLPDEGSLEASHYPVPLTVPSGRIYALTALAFTYSDDDGYIWSKRYSIPWPKEITVKGGHTRHRGWTVGKPLVTEGMVYIPWARIRRPDPNKPHLMDTFIHRSDNILTESDPEKIRWRTFPEGSEGIKIANTIVGEEPQIQQLDDGRLMIVFRTISRCIGQTYSEDLGETWSPPEPAKYISDGRNLKNPRACPATWKTKKGQFLLWFHNHGGNDYSQRNPVWICGGIEKDGKIFWSEPEILFYDKEIKKRISYPDLVEEDGKYWITETDKEIARIHLVDPTFLEELSNQGKNKKVTRELLLVDLKPEEFEESVKLPRLADLAFEGGFTLDLWLRIEEDSKSQILLTNTDGSGNGFELKLTADKRIELNIKGSSGEAFCDTIKGLLNPGLHHVVAIVDGGPDIICFVIDGVLCDGKDQRQYGWSRINPAISDVNGSGSLRILKKPGIIQHLRIYGNALRTTQVVANYYAGL